MNIQVKWQDRTIIRWVFRDQWDLEDLQIAWWQTAQMIEQSRRRMDVIAVLPPLSYESYEALSAHFMPVLPDNFGVFIIVGQQNDHTACHYMRLFDGGFLNQALWVETLDEAQLLLQRLRRHTGELPALSAARV